MSTTQSILALSDSLREYLNNPLILVERYHTPYEDLEDRKDIRYARVSFYEQNESITDQINDYRANLAFTNFGVDISVIRAYSKDNDTRGEIPLLDIRDEIIKWANQVSAPSLTDNFILAIGYQSTANPVRNRKFVNCTMNFEAIKDIHAL